jgi:hypothetical protein
VWWVNKVKVALGVLGVSAVMAWWIAYSLTEFLRLMHAVVG